MTLFIDSSESRTRLNPCVMHALSLIDNCGNNMLEARRLADFQLQCCPAQEFPHWLEVYAVLIGEIGGQA